MVTPSRKRLGRAAPVPEGAVPLHRIAGFRFFWLSRMVSGLGTAVTVVALPVLVFQQTGSPLLVSLVAASGTLPYLALGLVAGALADRADRRRLMIVTDALNAVCLASVPVARACGVLTVGHVLVVAFGSAGLAVFFEAAVYGLVPEVVGKGRLAEANSALYGGETVVRIVGSAVAGGLIVLLSPAGTLALDAVSFAVSALLVRAVPHTAGPPGGRGVPGPGVGEAVREGLRFLVRNPTLRTMTVVGTLVSFSAGGVVGQLVVFADRALDVHESDGRIGLLYTAWSAGGVGGSLLLPWLRRRFAALSLLLWVLPVGGGLGVVVVVSSDCRVALLGLVCWGTAYLVVLVNTMTYSQEVTPPELQGRVNTTRRMFSSGLGVPLGALGASAVTVQAGIRAGMVTAVAGMVLAGAVVWAGWVRRWARGAAG